MVVYTKCVWIFAYDMHLCTSWNYSHLRKYTQTQTRTHTHRHTHAHNHTHTHTRVRTYKRTNTHTHTHKHTHKPGGKRKYSFGAEHHAPTRPVYNFWYADDNASNENAQAHGSASTPIWQRFHLRLSLSGQRLLTIYTCTHLSRYVYNSYNNTIVYMCIHTAAQPPAPIPLGPQITYDLYTNMCAHVHVRA